MTTEDADDPLAGSRPALANSQTTPHPVPESACK